MEHWSFLTNHAQVLLCITYDPWVRLRDIASVVGVTERRAHAVVADLVAAGYVVKNKDGRRNRYHIQEHLPLPDQIIRERTIGELLAVLIDVNPHRNRHEPERTHHASQAPRQTPSQAASHSERSEGRTSSHAPAP